MLDCCGDVSVIAGEGFVVGVRKRGCADCGAR